MSKTFPLSAFTQVGSPSIQPRRVPRRQSEAAVAQGQAAEPAAVPLRLITLTPRGAYIKLPGNIGLPMEKFDAAVATFTKRDIPAEQASTEGFCVAHTALAELDRSGRPVVLTFKDKEFDVEAMPWLLWKLWQLYLWTQKR